MIDELRSSIEKAMDIDVKKLEAVSGGDINDAYKATLGDGSLCFIKTNKKSPSQDVRKRGSRARLAC